MMVLVKGNLHWHRCANLSSRKRFGQNGHHGRYVQYHAEVGHKPSKERVSVDLALAQNLKSGLATIMLAQDPKIVSTLQSLQTSVLRILTHCQIVLICNQEVSAKPALRKMVLLL